MDLRNGDCLKLMKSIPDKSIDLMICDLPYGETNCKWDSCIDLVEFWKEFKRIRKSKRTACIHFCSTKFGYTLIKSWEKGYKMDMVWKKRNKTGGLQSRHRPMRNHEMVYFFYEQAPKYNRDKYHKRIQQHKELYVKSDEVGIGKTKKAEMNAKHFEPPNPASVVEENDTIYSKKGWKMGEGFASKDGNRQYLKENPGYTPRQPGSVLEEEESEGQKKAKEWGFKKCSKSFDNNQELNGGRRIGPNYEPPNPVSIVEEFKPSDDEPVSMFESTKVFIGKRHHQTEKPQDILEFFIKYWTDEGETILDPTMGSGSTGVACKKLDRKFIGFELDEKIFKKAQERVKLI